MPPACRTGRESPGQSIPKTGAPGSVILRGVTDPDNIRVGDSARREVDTQLHRAHAEGFLTLAEYDERAAECWSAKTRRDLDVLTSDLPDLTDGEAPARADENPSSTEKSESDRRGTWAGLIPPAVMALGVLLLGSFVATSDDGASVFGERVVQMTDDSVQVGVLFGSVTVVVPNDAQVRQEGLLMFGGVDCLEACTPAGDREVVVDARGGFGSVEILNAQEFSGGVDLDDFED